MNSYTGIYKVLKNILADHELMQSVILFLAEKHPSFLVKAHSEVTGIPFAHLAMMEGIEIELKPLNNTEVSNEKQ